MSNLLVLDSRLGGYLTTCPCRMVIIELVPGHALHDEILFVANSTLASTGIRLIIEWVRRLLMNHDLLNLLLHLHDRIHHCQLRD